MAATIDRQSSAKDASTKSPICPVCGSMRWCQRPCDNHPEGRAERARRTLAQAEASAQHLARQTAGPKRLKRAGRTAKPRRARKT